MKKLFLLIAAFVIATPAMLMGQQQASPEDVKWFEEARLGMFVHFGPYAVLGSGEWVMTNRSIKTGDYRRLLDFFDPYAFDAKEWVAAAKSAGARYINLTSRHHDGFSNWDTKQSDWKITNTRYGKDIVKQLAEECDREGLKLILYYSTIDWMREDYPWETGRTGQGTGRSGPSDWDSYFEFMKAQITELLTECGPIAGLWFDGHWDQTEDQNRTSHETNIDWRYPELYAHIRSVDPHCLIANNHHLPTLPGEDYQIFERDVPGENSSGYSGQEVSHLPLETCETIGQSWGYNITDDQFKTVDQLVKLLVRTAGSGANLLLNVGPMPDGKIHEGQLERLAGLGQWTGEYGYTIYGTSAGVVRPEETHATTRKDNIHWLHIFDEETESFTLPLSGVTSVRVVNADIEIGWNETDGNLELSVPTQGRNTPDTIIEIIA